MLGQLLHRLEQALQDARQIVCLPEIDVEPGDILAEHQLNQQRHFSVESCALPVQLAAYSLSGPSIGGQDPVQQLGVDVEW